MVISISRIGQSYLIGWNDGTFEFLTDFELEERKIAARGDNDGKGI